MKKIFLIFLLLGSVVLAGCGENEDEAPSLIGSSPYVNQINYYGTELSLTFNAKMLVSSINLNSVYVINPSTNKIWPVVSTEVDGTCGDVEFAVDDTVPAGIDKQIVNIDIFASGCMLPPGTNLELIVTRNVKSLLGEALDKEYRIPFTTGL